MAKEKKPKENASAADSEEQPVKKKSFLKTIIIAVGALVLLGGIGFAAWIFFLAPTPEASDTDALGTETAESETAGAHGAAADKQEGKEGESPEALAPTAPPPGPVLNLEPFLVNLADTRSKRFLKARMAIDAQNEVFQGEIELRMPRIRDSLLLLLSSKTSADLSTTQGKLKLRSELLKTINNIMGSTGTVREVYFLEFVIQ